MNGKTYCEARHPSRSHLIQPFHEIAQTCVRAVGSGRGTEKVLSSLQSYLDGTITIGTAQYQRRAVVLAVHDMTDEKEAPVELQRKTLAQILVLNVRPIPQLRRYQDVATAILRMEVVVRLSAAQSSSEPKPDPLFSPAAAAYSKHFRQRLQALREAASVEVRNLIQVLVVELQAPAALASMTARLRFLAEVQGRLKSWA